MRFVSILVFAVACAAWGQVVYSPNPSTPQSPASSKAGNPPVPTVTLQEVKPVKPDAVVATVNGKIITAADFDAMVNVLPPQMKRSALLNRKEFLRQYAMLMQLTREAEQDGLDKKSPYKENLEYNRMSLLAQAQLNEALNKIVVTADEQKRYFEENPDKFVEAKIKVIYISFSSGTAPSANDKNSEKKILTEPEAKAKADRIVATARTGGDFVKLVKENSEDKTSADKDGDLGVMKKTDNYPEAVRTAVFSLKPGEVSEPVRQPNGFYIFRLEDLHKQTYDEVKNDIYKDLKQERWKEWLEAKRNASDIKIENENFFVDGSGK